MDPNYRSSQKDMYAGLRILWNNFALFLVSFTNFKGKYIAQYATDAKAAITAAENLPDHSANVGDAEAIRIELTANADNVVADFVSTERYIDEIHLSKEAREAQYKIAGKDYFEKALKNDWESVKQLGSKNLSYITTNETALKNGGQNMPDDFHDQVDTHLNDFSLSFEDYEEARQTSVETKAKITANNACMTTGRGMMNDAQSIFRNDAETLKLFTWDTILQLINPKVAGMQGTITEKDTNKPLAKVQVILQKENAEAITIETDEKGKYSATGIAAGKYTYKIMLDGKITITGEIKIKVGTVSRKKFVMEPAV
ncbi:MAG: carboxypeptidase regulatory-like domain-containing protein [Bacteroidia bacterium]